MAGKKENLKALFSNARTRVIILFTVALLLITVVIGFVKFNASGTTSAIGNLGHGPAGIRSIPGAQDQTAQYAALQSAQNTEQAQEARKTGTSAIPTIIHTQAFGSGVEVIGMKEGEAGIDFTALTRGDLGQAQKNIWMQTLTDAKCSKAAFDLAIAQGATLGDLRDACSCKQLKIYGYKVGELEPVCTCGELKSAGFNLVQMKDAGFTATQLRLCGYVACDEKGVGFTATQMKNAGFSDGELKGAGFSEQEIARAGGLPDGISKDDVLNAGSDIDALSRLRAAGVSAAAIRRISGVPIDKLKAAGFTPTDLRAAGFSAADLKQAGFNADDLKKAGFSAADLLNAGFTPDELKKAGFSTADIQDAASKLPAGLTSAQLHASGLTPARLKQSGYTADALKKAGFSAADLRAAGFTPEELKKAGFTPDDLKKAGFSASDLRAAGFTPDELKKAGFSAADLLNAGFTPEDLKKAGFSADDLLNAGATPDELKKAGFSSAEIQAAVSRLPTGLTPAQLRAAGLSPITKNINAVAKALEKADCSAKYLAQAHALGVTAAILQKTLGCNVAAFKDAGFAAADLHNAGFSAAELKKAGFGADALKKAGFSAKDLNAAGFTAKELKDTGFGADALKNAGYSAKELSTAGFTPKELKEAGFAADALKNAGYSPEELRAAGFTPKELKDAGFGVDALKKAGYSAQDLHAAGFTPKELKDAGFNAQQLGAAGLSNQDLQAAGFPALAALDNITPLTSSTTTIPSFGGQTSPQAGAEASNLKRLDELRSQQEKQMAAQRYQQKIQQRGNLMLAAANQSLQGWKTVPQQVYTAGSIKETESTSGVLGAENALDSGRGIEGLGGSIKPADQGQVVVKTGDILFAVIDTSVNTDEPGPILGTIVSGKLKGSKLIGTFNLPSNASKMVVSFNTISIPGMDKTLKINAYAIDPNTARTALSSQTDHHYLSRYGALFASTFLEGFGNAFQSANTTITIGGTGGTTDTTVTNGVGRSTLENAVIGLATVGKAWGQVAARDMNRPTTIELFSGTGVGILFTQDLRIS